jgi:site-specific recombinase XerD
MKPLDVLVTEYLERYAGSPNTQRAKRKDLINFFAFLQDRHIRTPRNVSIGLCNEFRDTRLMTASPRTVLREISTLKHFWRVVLNLNTWEGVKMPTVAPFRPVRMKREEIQSWRATLSNENDNESVKLLAFLNVAYLSGLRISEILGLRMGQIDMNRQVFVGVKCKGNKFRDVPYPAELMLWLAPYFRLREALLKERGVNPNDGDYPLLISTKAARFSKPESFRIDATTIRRWCKKWLRFKPHDFRRYFGKTLSAKMGIEVAQEALGHSNIMATQIYTYADVCEVRRGFEYL